MASTMVVLSILFFVVWLAMLISVAASPRVDGVEKALWVFINLMFPLIGYLVFVIAKPAPKRTLRDIASGK